jgi:molecular chaperone GrpE
MNKLDQPTTELLTINNPGTMNAEFAETVKNFETTMSEDAASENINPLNATDVSKSAEDLGEGAEMDNESGDLNVDPVVNNIEEVEAEAIAVDPLEEAPETSGTVDPDALTRLATEVESLRLQIEERTSQYMRIAADFDNFRKRTEREKSELELRVKRDAISELLPVIDSFERSRTQIKPDTEQEVNIHKSYQGVYKQLVDGLKRVGVSPMRVEGQPFDPNFHDAIMREPTEEHPEGTIIEELRRGYLLGEMVLRHAMVKVAALPEKADDSDSENSTGHE